MSPSLSYLTNFFIDHQSIAYLILFAAMVFEGETFMIISGVLSNLGALNLFYVILISFVGVILGDMFWYFFGVMVKHEKVPEFIRKFIFMYERVVDKVLPHFKERPLKSLVIAKFIYGTNHATLILSGIMRVNFRLFMKAEVIASSIWVLVFTFLGYLFGYAAITISHRVSIFLLVILLLIVGFILLQRTISFYYENRENKD